MKQVIIAPHMRCNARCAHCCVSSSPSDGRRLTDETVNRLVDEAIDSEDIEVISFTGGEALLRRAFMLDLIARVSRAGKVTTLVSNAFWAIAPKIAVIRLRELADAGLSKLTISADEFHLPYIKIGRVKNALMARHEVPSIRMAINMCESRSNSSDGILDELKELLEGVQVTRSSVSPVGSAAALPDDEIAYRRYSDDKGLRCPGQVLLFSSDDRAYPCCSTGVMNSALSIGAASDLSIDEGSRRIENNLIFRIMTREGLGWFVDRLGSAGVERFQKPFPVVDSCHLCCEIFSNSEHLRMLRPEFERYRAKYEEEVMARAGVGR